MKSFTATAFFFSFFLTTAAFAGGSTVGNGGQAILCEPGNISTRPPETFDLFEGRALHPTYRYPELKNGEALPFALELARKLDASQGIENDASPTSTLEGKVRFVAEKMEPIGSGVGLKLTEDSDEFISVPNDCEKKQVINFRSNMKIYFDPDIWSVLPETSKAALYLHEAVYWHLRESGIETDSRRTRRIVSYLFNGGELEPRLQLPFKGESEVQYCYADETNRRLGYVTKLYVYKNEYNEFIVQFADIGGYVLLGRTTLSTRVTATAPTLIQKDAPQVSYIDGILSSPVDTEMNVSLSWGKGSVKIEGAIQEGVSFSDKLTCETFTLSL